MIYQKEKFKRVWWKMGLIGCVGKQKKFNKGMDIKFNANS